jgi:hypothetical protein
VSGDNTKVTERYFNTKILLTVYRIKIRECGSVCLSCKCFILMRLRDERYETRAGEAECKSNVLNRFGK